MFYVSEIQNTAPNPCQTPLQGKSVSDIKCAANSFRAGRYRRGDYNGRLYQHQQRIKYEDGENTLSLQSAEDGFYLFITAGDKPFRSKDFSTALNISRVSFAPADLMETMLGTRIGAATIFSCLLDTDKKVKVVFDKEVLEEEWYGCSDGTTTGYMKVRTDDIYHHFLEFTNHTPVIIEV